MKTKPANSARSMSMAELRLYLLLCRIADHKDQSYLDNSDLGALLNVSANHISHLIGSLAQKGWLTVMLSKTYFAASSTAMRTIKVIRRQA